MEQLDFYSSKVVELYDYLSASIFEIVCKALKKQLDAKDETISLADWQVNALLETGQLNRDTLAKIAEVSGLTEDAVRQAVYRAGYDTAANVDEYLSGKPTPPFNPMIQTLENLVGQAVYNIDNLVNQTLISANVTGQIYTDIINRVTAEASVGILTLEEAVGKAVNEWLDKGIPSGFMDKGGHVWSIENYVKTTILTTINNAFNECTYERMNEYGIYTVVVGSHPAARPACAKIQGKVVDLRPMSELPPSWPYRSVYDPYWDADYKQPHGHRGINCHHPHLPFDPDFDINDMAQYDPADAIKKDKIEATRKRKANAIRKTKKKLTAYQALGNEQKTRYYKNLLNKQRRDMVQYTKEHDLRRLYQLEKVRLPDDKVIEQVKRGLVK